MAASARAPEDLYGLPLEEFTPARDALAKELKAAGRKEEAAGVKSLRKPSVAAWALNRAARDHGDAIDRLRAAGHDLRAAQSEAMSGDAGRLREAGRALADEVDRVAGLAADALRDAGRPASAAQQEKLVATLRTAAVDDDAGDLLARGVLADDLEATGFSLLGSGSGDLSATLTRPPDAVRPSGAPGGVEDGDGGSASGRSPGGGEDGDGGRSSGTGRVGTLPGAQRAPRKPKPSKEALEAAEAARREVRRCDAEADQAATRARRRAERAEAAAHRAVEAQREADEARAAAEDAAGEAEAARRRAADAADQLAAAEAALPT